MGVSSDMWPAQRKAVPEGSLGNKSSVKEGLVPRITYNLEIAMQYLHYQYIPFLLSSQLGRRMAEFPVDPMMSKMLIASEK